MTSCGYLWGVPVPTRPVTAVVPAVSDWCRSRRLRRPLLLGGSSLTATPQGLATIHALEAEGLAVWAFDRAASPSMATVAEAVAGLHFESCDCVVAIGGAVAVEVAKATAVMAGQRTPWRELEAEPGEGGVPVDASAVPPLLVVPATPAAALGLGAAIWIADETGAARPLRHPAARPDEAVLAADVVAEVPPSLARRSTAVAALVAADAGVAEPVLDALLSVADDPRAALHSALTLAAVVEGASGPRRRLALTAAVMTGADFADALVGLAPAGEWGGRAAAILRQPGSGRAPVEAAVLQAARAACRRGDADALDRVLEGLGLELRAVPRRRGRQVREG